MADARPGTPSTMATAPIPTVVLLALVAVAVAPGSARGAIAAAASPPVQVPADKPAVDTPAVRFPGGHGLALEVGRFWQGLEDDLASTTRYAGDAAVAGIGYRFRGERWRAGVSLAGASPRLTPADAPRLNAHEEGRWWTADAWVLRRVWRSGDGRWRAFAGPATAVDVGLRRHYYRLDRSETFDNAFAGLQATALVELDVGDAGRLSERLMLPVVGVAVRTPYNTGRGGEAPLVAVEGPLSFLLARHRFEYRYTAGPRMVVGLHHEGTLVRHDRPMDMAVAWHRFGVGVEWTWGRP